MLILSAYVVCTYVFERTIIMCEIIWVLKHLNCILNRPRCWCIKAKDLILTYNQQVAMMKLTRFHHLTLRQSRMSCHAHKLKWLLTSHWNSCVEHTLYFIIPIQCMYLPTYTTTTTCLYLYILYALEILYFVL